MRVQKLTPLFMMDDGAYFAPKFLCHGHRAVSIVSIVCVDCDAGAMLVMTL